MRYRYGLLLAFAAAVADSGARETTSDTQALAEVEALARCAAFYFNATKARPMNEYESLYSAGERAVNRARHIMDADHVDRLIGEASIEMTALTGANWVNFERVRIRYGAQCEQLVGTAE